MNSIIGNTDIEVNDLLIRVEFIINYKIFINKNTQHVE